jgi:subtilisin family serine protease
MSIAIRAGALVPLLLLAVPALAESAGDKIANSVICQFKPGQVGRGSEQAEAARSAGAGNVTHVYKNSIQGFAARMPLAAAERMAAANPRIAFCEADQIVTNGKPGGGGGTQPTEVVPWGVVRVNGGTASGPFATAWVIDSGIDLTHPDLNVDTARSRSFLGGTTTAADQNGHGTHVAGTIAARANGIGVVGVAPGAPVVAVRVLDRRGSGTNSGVIAGVDYVAGAGRSGDVANMSLGGGVSSALDAAVVAAASRGIRFTLAAGNSGVSATTTSPARANGANVYTVSAFAQGDVFASFSNFGNPPVDFAQPGVSIRSTWLAGGYNTISGTSMAAPHLAGLLLVGAVVDDGFVSGDPDGIADVIGASN